MTAETDLLPLPDDGPYYDPGDMQDYARANLAELQREVEGLRAEVAAWSKSYDRAVDLGQQHRDHAERLAEALLEIAEFDGDPNTPARNSVKKSAIARAALHPAATQEDGND